MSEISSENLLLTTSQSAGNSSNFGLVSSHDITGKWIHLWQKQDLYIFVYSAETAALTHLLPVF